MINKYFVWQESEQRSMDAQMRGQLEMLTQLSEEQKVCFVSIFCLHIYVFIFMSSFFMTIDCFVNFLSVFQ